MEIKDLLNQTDKLPNIPEVVRKIVNALNEADANYTEISQKVTKDQIISLKILRLVNSAYFGLSRKIASIDEAVIILGMGKLKTLVIASGFANCASKVEGIDLPIFWSDSFQVAELAKIIASKTEGKVDPDLAFTCGIIHNIGQLLLHMAQPNRAMAIKSLLETSDTSRSEAEIERLGFTTTDAGQALLGSWNFPPALVSAIKYQNNPIADDTSPELSAILNLACFINKAAKNGDNLEQVVENFPSEIASLAGLPAVQEDLIAQLLTLKSGLDSLAD